MSNGPWATQDSLKEIGREQKVSKDSLDTHYTSWNVDRSAKSAAPLLEQLSTDIDRGLTNF